MRLAVRGLLCALGALAWAALSVPTHAAGRPYQGNGACLSCHAGALATLPSGSCLSCHSGNMRFLSGSGHGAVESGDTARGLVSAATVGIVGLGVLLLVPVLRRSWAPLTLVACVTLAQAIEVETLPSAPLPGGLRVSEGVACDLAPLLAPSADALVFATRGVDTNADGQIDLRDDLALRLQRRGAASVALTGHVLDFAGAMAAWSPDGRRLVVPMPLRDTDGDGRVTHADRHGLALFEASGRRVATLEAGELDLLGPLFSPDGSQVAFVAGTTVGVWQPDTGLRETRVDVGPHEFPRLFGWDEKGGQPLFTRGFDYADLPRDAAHDYAPPPEVAIEGATDGRAVTLTPPAAAARRRARPQTSKAGLFHLADDAHGGRGLFRVDWHGESRWTPPGLWLYGFEPAAGEGCWILGSVGRGSPARLARLGAPGRVAWCGGAWEPQLITWAATSDGRALIAARPRGAAERGLFLVTASGGPALLAQGAWFTITTAGRALAGVRVPSDSDGDGVLSALDRGELWVSWEAL